uniref:NELL2-interacting cell ontogeny regulator 1 n=1 Tax=Poecilia reticulata TaxID=8081 RepID=A0A3P9N8E6_POERE
GYRPPSAPRALNPPWPAGLSQTEPPSSAGTGGKAKLVPFLNTVLAGRPCVDCHAFEFMQRALQDLKKTAFNLDARTETLVLRAERRALCDCMPTTTLR